MTSGRKGDKPGALAAAGQAVALARQSGDDELLALVLGNLSASLSQLDRDDEALAAAREQQQAGELTTST